MGEWTRSVWNISVLINKQRLVITLKNSLLISEGWQRAYSISKALTNKNNIHHNFPKIRVQWRWLRAVLFMHTGDELLAGQYNTHHMIIFIFGSLSAPVEWLSKSSRHNTYFLSSATYRILGMLALSHLTLYSTYHPITLSLSSCALL